MEYKCRDYVIITPISAASFDFESLSRLPDALKKILSLVIYFLFPFSKY